MAAKFTDGLFKKAFPVVGHSFKQAVAVVTVGGANFAYTVYTGSKADTNRLEDKQEFHRNRLEDKEEARKNRLEDKEEARKMINPHYRTKKMIEQATPLNKEKSVDVTTVVPSRPRTETLRYMHGEEGKFIAIFGPPQSGKTTFLKSAGSLMSKEEEECEIYYLSKSGFENLLDLDLQSYERSRGVMPELFPELVERVLGRQKNAKNPAFLCIDDFEGSEDALHHVARDFLMRGADNYPEYNLKVMVGVANRKTAQFLNSLNGSRMMCADFSSDAGKYRTGHFDESYTKEGLAALKPLLHEDRSKELWVD